MRMGPAGRPKRTSRLTRDAFSAATAVFAAVGTLVAVAGFSLRDLVPGNPPTWILALFVAALYAAAVAIIRFVKWRCVRKGIRLKIRGDEVEVRRGDLFACDGWKVVPFNEFYDTKVDDVVISRSSLNGVFIKEYAKNLAELRSAIVSDGDSTLLPPTPVGEGRLKYELGTVKRYGGECLLLAFTHFNEHNEAHHLSMADYEQCLMRMWREIYRVHAGRPVFVPLLGAGITRFDDFGEKSLQDLLKCLVCTLRASRMSFSKPITFVLTGDAFREVSLYELKEME